MRNFWLKAIVRKCLGVFGGAGKEGLAEGVVEIEDVGKIFGFIVVLFAEDACFDEEKDHIAEVERLADAPFVDEGGSHGAELFEGEIAKSFDELSTRDVVGGFF